MMEKKELVQNRTLARGAIPNCTNEMGPTQRRPESADISNRRCSGGTMFELCALITFDQLIFLLFTP